MPNIVVVWSRVLACAGALFHTVTGVPLTYVSGNNYIKLNNLRFAVWRMHTFPLCEPESIDDIGCPAAARDQGQPLVNQAVMFYPLPGNCFRELFLQGIIKLGRHLDVVPNSHHAFDQDGAVNPGRAIVGLRNPAQNRGIARRRVRIDCDHGAPRVAFED